MLWNRRRRELICINFLISITLSGCCHTKLPCKQTVIVPNPDPFECMNRKIYDINHCIDKCLGKPVAKTYVKVTPLPFKSWVKNFFSNLNDIDVTLNDVLQFNFPQAFRDATRFALNSSFGMLGFIDVASSACLTKHNTDFGITLGKWGIKNSPYVVIPILGPSTVRDGVGMVADWFLFSAWDYFHPSALKYGLLGTSLLDIRANLLEAEKFLDSVSLDPYVALRDAYLQKRKFLISGDLVNNSANSPIDINDDFSKDDCKDDNNTDNLNENTTSR